jgi:pimeloyl-ACP methyl ester carboxylesterase
MPSIHAGDLDVYYIENGTQGGLGSIIFVHGNWATSSWWEPVLARLPDNSWRSIAYDVRGRGRTTGPDSDYSIPSLAADLGSFIAALGLDSPHLVGHSFGSAIVMQYALDHPAKVRSLTVVAPAWVDGMPNPTELER